MFPAAWPPRSFQMVVQVAARLAVSRQSVHNSLAAYRDAGFLVEAVKPVHVDLGREHDPYLPIEEKLC